MDLKKYSFKEYSETYKTLFKKERIKLKKILPNAIIEHIGSSSVKNLGGKGIIDIIISIPKDKIKLSKERLEKNRYDYIHSGGDKDRIFFQKIIKYNGEERRVHIHLSSKDTYAWKAAIAIRNYLNKHEKARIEYEKVKRNAVRYAKGEGAKYRKYKDSFLKKLEKKALKE